MVKLALSSVTSAQGSCEATNAFSSSAACSTAPPMVKLVEMSTLAAARFSAWDEAEACCRDSCASAAVSSRSLGQPVRTRVIGRATRYSARFMLGFVAVDMPDQYGAKLAQFRPCTTTPYERLFAGRELEFSSAGGRSNSECPR